MTNYPTLGLSLLLLASNFHSEPARAWSESPSYQTGYIVCDAVFDDDSQHRTRPTVYASFSEDQLPSDLIMNRTLAPVDTSYPNAAGISRDSGLYTQWKEFASDGANNFKCFAFRDQSDANSAGRDLRDWGARKVRWVPGYPSDPSGQHATWSDVNYIYLGRRVSDPRKSDDDDYKDHGGKYWYCYSSELKYRQKTIMYYSDVFSTPPKTDGNMLGLKFGAYMQAVYGGLRHGTCVPADGGGETRAEVQEQKDREMDHPYIEVVETGWHYRSNPPASNASRRNLAKPAVRKRH